MISMPQQSPDSKDQGHRPIFEHPFRQGHVDRKKNQAQQKAIYLLRYPNDQKKANQDGFLKTRFSAVSTRQ